MYSHFNSRGHDTSSFLAGANKEVEQFDGRNLTPSWILSQQCVSTATACVGVLLFLLTTPFSYVNLRTTV